jgi:hypothetical protein
VQYNLFHFSFPENVNYFPSPSVTYKYYMGKAIVLWDTVVCCGIIATVPTYMHIFICLSHSYRVGVYAMIGRVPVKRRELPGSGLVRVR